MSLIPLPPSLIPFLHQFLPTPGSKTFVTLTYAQSLDSRIAARPGVQTKISHLETKTMTHYLRSEHDAILVGIGTVLADNPKLNCRYNGGNSPIPVVIDPLCQWEYAKSQLHQICESGQGRAPIIIIDDKSMPSQDNERILGLQGGRYLKLPLLSNRTNNWSIILDVLYELGIKSVMVEGGAKIINELLAYKEPIIDSLIITIGPVFLGNEGVEVSPSRHVDLSNVKWWSGIQDSIMCASVEH